MGDLELLCDAAPIEIGNRVWNDLNNDGVQDPGEPGRNGLIVSLQGPINTVTTSTDVNGLYYFGNLKANTAYTLTMNVPSGYSLTTPNAEALNGASVNSNHPISDTRDSDAVLVSGVATIYYTTGSAGQNNHGLDFGFTQPAAGQVDIVNTAPAVTVQRFGDRLWLESDTDGDATTNFIGPVANHLITATAQSGTVYTTTTDSNGFYTFTVPAGVYTVTYGLPPTGYEPSSTPGGSIVTVASSGNDLSHADYTVVTLNAGETITTVDFGFTLIKVSIGNLVWEDGDDNGLYEVGEDLIDNLTMELWLDLDNDGLSEPLGDDGSTPLSTTVTVNGIYSFTKLAPDSYFVRIPAPPPVTPLSSIPSDAPDNGVDNDDNGSQPGGPNAQILSPVINLAVGDEPGSGGGGNDDMTVDFGLVDPFIGNLVWHDVNNNGQIDSGEPGIAGVMVTLLYDADNNEAIEGAELTPFRTTTTDQDGIYVFPDLVPSSNYQVIIPVSNFATGGALATLRFSSDPTNTGDNQQDEDDNGIQVSPSVTVTSPLINLTVDAEPTDGDSETGRGNDLDNGDDNNGDMTIDFGFVAPMGQLSIRKTLVEPAGGVANLGDRIIYDLRIENSGTLTITSVTVKDIYDTGYLQYSSASITPTASATGVLTWTLSIPTAPLPLSVGEAMTVTVEFTATKP